MQVNLDTNLYNGFDKPAVELRVARHGFVNMVRADGSGFRQWCEDGEVIKPGPRVVFADGTTATGLSVTLEPKTVHTAH